MVINRKKPVLLLSVVVRVTAASITRTVTPPARERYDPSRSCVSTGIFNAVFPVLPRIKNYAPA